MNNSLCIPERELADLLQGKLADDRLEQVVQHVDDCSSCQDTVQMLAEQSDTFANAWQGGVAEDSGESEPEYRHSQGHALSMDLRRLRAQDFLCLSTRLSCSGIAFDLSVSHVAVRSGEAESENI